jgi:hypothetical protein
MLPRYQHLKQVSEVSIEGAINMPIFFSDSEKLAVGFELKF